ncbi:MAG: ABC transporter permease, partial [Gammaproteobacteria bacterium]
VVEPTGPTLASELAEIWRQRELLSALIARQVHVRYAQTWVGVAWVVLKPLSTMLLLWAMFGRVAALPTGGIPYPLFFFSGLVLWFFLSGSITDSKDSLVDNADLVRKVYFPRALLPIATVIARLLDLGIMLAFLAVLLVLHGAARPSVLAAVALLGLAMLLATGVGVGLAALNVRFRDTTHVVPVALQLLLLASPVIYSADLVPATWRAVYALNPVVGIVEGFRAAVLGRPLPADAIAIAGAVTAALFAVGALVFRRMEPAFADHV